MDIFKCQLDDRCGSFPDLRPGEAACRGDFLLLMHPNYPDDESGVVDWTRGVLADRNCRGILFLKGVAFAGFGRRFADQLHKQFGDRVHVLSYAVSERLAGPRAQAFERFFNSVREENRIDWEMIDPSWPEHLVGVALLLCALRHGDTDFQEKLHHEWLIQDELWRSSFLEAALSEFQERNGGCTDELKASLAVIDGDQAESRNSMDCIEKTFLTVCSALPKRTTPVPTTQNLGGGGRSL